jgi:transcriptional regulator with XRE-family HTH domain
MKHLKEIRQAHNLSQEEVAKMLKTTQQTIARWEASKAEPNINALRDLAMIFGTSVDDLLGTNPISNKVTSTILYQFGENTMVDGFGGHVGLLLRGEKQTKWFPITLETANTISKALANMEEDNEFFYILTLNNRLLLINPTKVRRIWLLDDACDPPEDWGKEAAEDYSGNPIELYRGLDAYFYDRDDLCKKSSEPYIKVIEGFIKKRKIDAEKADQLLHETSIFMADGTIAAYYADPSCLWQIMFNLDLDDMPKMLAIHSYGGDYDSYYPTANVAVVSMPLIDVMDAAKEFDAEMAEDTESKVK